MCVFPIVYFLVLDTLELSWEEGESQVAKCCKQAVQALVPWFVEALGSTETPPKTTAQSQMVLRRQGS